MPTNGYYEFKLSTLAIDGIVPGDGIDIKPGEWGWVRQHVDGLEFLAIYAGCPDCKHLMTIWRRFNGQSQGHTVFENGHINPSVLHTWRVDGVEQCGFHSMPTRLLGFIDAR